MDLKSLEDWVVEKNLKAVPDVVDVASFGGPTREYQVRIDPNKLVSYGLSLAQVEQQLTNNNANAGGSFVEAGLQQINVREVGPDRKRRGHRKHGDHQQDRNPGPHQGHRGGRARAEDLGSGRSARAIRSRKTGTVVDNDDVVSGIALLRKGADAEAALRGIHEKVKELNEQILPTGVKVQCRSSIEATWCTTRRTRSCTISPKASFSS